MGETLILLFDSVHHVLRAEKLLLQAGFNVRTKPVPRQLSSDCGICLYVEKADQADLIKTLPAGARPRQIFKRKSKREFVCVWQSEEWS